MTFREIYEFVKDGKEIPDMHYFNTWPHIHDWVQRYGYRYNLCPDKTLVFDFNKKRYKQVRVHLSFQSRYGGSVTLHYINEYGEYDETRYGFSMELDADPDAYDPYDIPWPEKYDSPLREIIRRIVLYKLSRLE